MKDLLWENDGVTYEAGTITINDEDKLGRYLKGFLLGDLKYIPDVETRLETQAMIQMRDYGIDDVRRHLGRKDIRYKFIELMFKNDRKFTPEMIMILDSDSEKCWQLITDVMIESGIIVEVKNQENPPQENLAGSPSAESG